VTRHRRWNDCGWTTESLRVDNESLRVDNDRLHAETEALADRVSALEAAGRADSTTTSKPPSQVLPMVALSVLDARRAPRDCNLNAYAVPRG